MDIVRFAIEKPVTVIVGVILVVLFGLIGLFSMPYQLSPTVTEPEITVTTTWRGATPYEIERDIIEEQEKVLKGVTGLVEMESSSFNNQGTITLRFKVGTDVDTALLRVSNKLDEVPSYPENVEKPIINATGAATSPVIWMILKTRPDNSREVWTYRTYFENEVRQHLERVEGVADLFLGGGTENQMHVVLDPEKLASFGLTAGDVIRVLGAENVNISAGIMGVERRDYRIRTIGEFESPAEIEDVVISSTGQQRVKISDVGKAEYGYEVPDVAMLHNAKKGIAIGVKPEPGANVLELTDRVEEVVERLNTERLAPRDIYLEWVYDQRPYIRGAIDLVRNNILIGGVLAITVLLVFLRSVSSTVVVATAIPISIVGTFILMSTLGRNLNVVSLAGIAFAVGMLVDNAIVVLENIDRHRTMGKSAFEAAYDGAREVWGAVFASTMTTIAVFLPVVFIEEEAGQLFRDIAIAITCSVALSLLVSVLVIPMFSKQLYELAGEKKKVQWARFIGSFGERVTDAYMGVVNLAVRNSATRTVTILFLTAFAVVSTLALFPKMEYLPQGNRNLIINILVPPPGLSFEERTDIGEHVFASVEPYMDKDEYNGVAGIKNMFYVGSEQLMLFGGISTQEQRATELMPVFTGVMNSIPGMFGVSNQASIFEQRIGRGRTVDVDFSGDDIDRLVQGAGMMFGMILERVPGAQVRPIPSLELLYPEVRIIPDRDRLRSAGMTTTDLGIYLDVLEEGREIGDFKEPGEKKIDLIVKASEEDASTPEDIYNALVATPAGRTVPVSSLSALERTYGINQIRHLERRRTITLQVTPPVEMPLEQAMDIIRTELVPALDQRGALQGVDLTLAGAADKLSRTREAVQWNFLLAAVITYLLMSALFGNFIYPFIIMFTVPLAAAGGFIGLRVVNAFIARQPLDILTMLGFVILIGVVVNNAILIVHQALNNIRYQGMSYKDAVLDSTRTRLRPIYMSASTSIFGMLPLVVAPGPGSELYRGIGSVVLGGLAFSTIFTIFVVPSLLLFFVKIEKPGEKAPEEQAEGEGEEIPEDETSP